jgi:hypothetical protein
MSTLLKRVELLANVSGTPTLILVNNEGVASDVWSGKLPADTESKVLSKL